MTKEDREVLHSPGHHAQNRKPPTTTAASQAAAANRATILHRHKEKREIGGKEHSNYIYDKEKVSTTSRHV